ncbi:MAG: leucine--tRNA ligase [Verrucomicrobiota bacterium JB024]|nr:leucine--tRNA ligase [Verrucomicrobiota bacterium JB024]
MATRCDSYDFSRIESHWQDFWADNKTFYAQDFADKPTWYVLDMFPYPSGAGLHIGHPEGYTATDALKRFKKAQGFNVLHPMGWDAFGLPTEQFAIKTGEQPAVVTKRNIARFKEQLRAIGLTYDWDREVNTTDPHYFRWTQWIFLKLFKKGLAYVDEKPVWFCPDLGTVLANEEVLNTPEGPRSERGDFPVERRPLRQWVLRITAYADKLLAGLNDVNWPDSTKRLQANWIGRSEGAEVVFGLDGFDDTLTVFTTRPDTLFGATYMVVAPEHPLVSKITSAEQREAVAAYIQKAANKSDLERAELSKEKTGVFTGAYAINPVNGKKIPVWVADYVLMSYGTGAIMAVPAHDERDFAFAKEFGLEIIPVVGPLEKDAELLVGPSGGPENRMHLVEVDGKEAHVWSSVCKPFSGDGFAINSGPYNGLPTQEIKKQIVANLEKQGRGKATVNFKLRDWLFSRQRYWGEPFPIVWVSKADYAKVKAGAAFAGQLPAEPVTCTMDGKTWFAVPLPESALPLTLPETESYQPSPDGQSPLANLPEWLEVALDPATGTVKARSEISDTSGLIEGLRETNTMPQWAGSCWYYLRYIDPRNAESLIDSKKEAYWGMPDLYVGGAEHAVLHLLYARFWHRFLFDEGVLSVPEPFTKLFHQGIILGEDGEKMSKSRGNVVNPDDIIKDYGADTLRLYLMFLGPLEAKKPWNTKGIEGMIRFLRKLWREVLAEDGSVAERVDDAPESPETLRVLHETIKKVTADYEALSFNTAISQLMICLNAISKAGRMNRTTARTFVQLLAPLAPHLCEELWERLGGEAGSVSATMWPQCDESLLVDDTVKIIVQVNGKLRGELTVPKDTAKDEILAQAKGLERVAAQMEGLTVVKEIYVPGKIVNLVVK